MPNNDAIPMNVVEVLASAELNVNDNSESVAMSVAEGGAGSSGKADKVSGATAGDLAGLDATGNLTDSGKKPADFVAAENFYATQLPMSSTDPTTVAEKATDLLSAIDGKADLIRDSVSNVPIASVPDAAANLPLSALKIAIDPIQAGSGDPSPDNIRPISGRTGGNVFNTGVNLWGGETMADDIVSAINNSSYSAKGTDTDGKYVSLVGNNQTTLKNLFPSFKFKENTQYTFIIKAKKTNVDNYHTNIRFVYTDGTYTNMFFSNNSTLPRNTIDTKANVSTSGKTVAMIQSVYASGEIYIYYESCGLFEGVLTTADFKPYIGSTIPITWQSSAGTVYGGSPDVLTGVLSANRVYYKGGWTHYASGNGYKAYRMQNIPYGKGYGITEPMSNMISEFGSFSLASMDKNIIQPPTNTSNSAYMALHEDLDPDDVEFSYLVLTPTTYQLDPIEVKTLLSAGQMNVWADTGNIIEMTYPCDTKLYIDKKLAELTALVLES